MKKYISLFFAFVLMFPLVAFLETVPPNKDYTNALNQLEKAVSNQRRSIEEERKTQQADVAKKLNKGDINQVEASTRDIIIAFHYKNRLIALEEANDLVTIELNSMNWETSLSENEVVSMLQRALHSIAKPNIRFRDIEWYATKEEVERALYSIGAEKAGWSTGDSDIYRMSGTNFSSVTTGSDRVDDGGFMGWYRGLTVAGYSPSNVYACFMFPILNNEVVHDKERAEFYFGWYTFDRNDFSDHFALFEDLLVKLKFIYGEPSKRETKYYTAMEWYDAEGNTVRLFINADKNYVTLGYMAADADYKLDQLQEALDMEAASSEAENREENKDNLDGL